MLREKYERGRGGVRMVDDRKNNYGEVKVDSLGV